MLYNYFDQGYIFLPIRGQMGREKKSAFEKEGKKIKDEKGRKKKKREGKEKRREKRKKKREKRKKKREKRKKKRGKKEKREKVKEKLVYLYEMTLNKGRLSSPFLTYRLKDREEKSRLIFNAPPYS